MAVYFHEEIVPGVAAPRSEILDRRETDFKAGEIAVRQDDNPESSVRGPESAEVSPKSKELLRQGEELYARGLYHEAIHVWTRVLFLERGNSDARLRIDKAKETLAERERRLDVEIAEAKGLFASGEIQAARERVRFVLAADGRHSEAVQLDSAIEARERRRAPEVEEESPTAREADPLTAPPSKGVVFKVPKAPRSPSAREGRPSASSFQMTAFLLGAVLLFGASALYLRQNWEAIVSDGAFGRPADLAPSAPVPFAAPVPDLSQLRYYNGERLFAQGRYREALAQLGRVERDSRVFSEARSLILRIEERLLRGAAGPEPAIEAER